MKVFKGLKYFVMGVGLYKIGEYGYAVGNELYLRQFKEKQELRQIYGDCYAFISDSSSDLGNSYATQLAKNKFNLILVAKSAEVLRLQKQELEAQYGVQVSTFEFDPSQASITTGIDAIYNQIKDLDIGLLVNSAETYQLQRFDHLYPREIKEAINANVLTPTLFLNTLIPKLLQREKRACIITVGSALGDHPVGYLSLYSATKAFNNTLSRALSHEFQDKLDIVTALPGPTETIAYKALFGGKENEDVSYLTRLTQAFKNSFILSTPDESAEATLEIADSKNEIAGTKKHLLYSLFQKSLPYVDWRTGAFSRLFHEFGEQRTSNIPPLAEVIEAITQPETIKVVEPVIVAEPVVLTPVVVAPTEVQPVVTTPVVTPTPTVETTTTPAPYKRPEIPVDITRTLSNDFLLQFITKEHL